MSQRAHVSVFPRNRVWVLQRLPHLKYYNVWKLERKCTFKLNVAENTDFMKN